MPYSSSAPSEADTLRLHLQQPLRQLRFSNALEIPFLTHLRESQKRSALFTLSTVSVLWLVYGVLDFWRLHALADTGYASDFFWRAMVPRWLVGICFACAFYTLLRPQSRRSDYECSMAGAVLACCIAIAASSYTLKNAGLPETSVVMVLTVGVAFFPLGMRMRWMAPVAALLCLIITLAGPLILHDPQALQQHWVLSAVAWGTLVLCGATAYYREKSMREQFVLRRMLDWEASHDPLTSLPNRRMFHEQLQRCMRQAQREQVPLFLVLLDIDHFKRYNDHYGHLAGDAALRQFAALLRQFGQRPLDLPVRLGGEEFGLLIYNMSAEQLRRHLEKLRHALQDLQLPHCQSPTAPYVTASMGATPISAHDTPDSVLQRADTLLYTAKHHGRNRVCMAGDVLHPAPESAAAMVP